MNRLLSFACSLFLFFQTAFSQQVISTAGESTITDGFEISWTIGEPVISTISGNSFYLTQGFQQSNLAVTKIEENSIEKLNIKVYPNPASECLIIQHEGRSTFDNLVFTIVDSEGKILQKGILDKNPQQFDMSSYASGIYLLSVMVKNETQINAFKVVKK